MKNQMCLTHQNVLEHVTKFSWAHDEKNNEFISLQGCYVKWFKLVNFIL
jgi:hypothetical protein